MNDVAVGDLILVSLWSYIGPALVVNLTDHWMWLLAYDAPYVTDTRPFRTSSMSASRSSKFEMLSRFSEVE